MSVLIFMMFLILALFFGPGGFGGDLAWFGLSLKHVGHLDWKGDQDLESDVVARINKHKSRVFQWSKCYDASSTQDSWRFNHCLLIYR